MSWRDVVLDFMRVPPEPEPPPGSPPRVFRASPNFYKLRLFRWAITQMAAVIGLLWAIYFVSWIAGAHVPRFVVWMFRLGEVFAWAAFVFEMVVGVTLVRLDYELRWYMLSDRAIRIREGIATVREKTIALANVQNLAVRQGPLQRLLGIADVEVKTAGGGGSSGGHEGKKGHAEPMHVAYFRGVDNAEQIRDLVLEGVRTQRNTGLGDAEEEEHFPDAITELLTEVRALRNWRERL